MAMGVNMSRAARVLLVCPTGLLRETILEGLGESAHEVRCVDSLRELVAGADAGFDVGLYVAPEVRGVLAEQDADLLEGVGAQNWLVLSDRRDNPIYTRLMRDNLPVCAVPLEVSRHELPHLIVLATRNRRLCIRAQCDACPSSAVRRIDASLDDRQWQLMRYLSEGLSNKEIARIEHCTEGNVKVRVRGLLDRLHANNRTQAAVMAARAGLSYSRPRGGDSSPRAAS